MELLNFIATISLVTASGVLAPGPLFFATLSYGATSGARSGFVFSLAHMCVEFSLVMLLALGLVTAADTTLVKMSTGIIGGIMLVILGVMQVRNVFHVRVHESTASNVSIRHLFVTGSVLTGLNPVFLVWWLTIGANLIVLALEFASLAGVVFMYLCHVWMDYLWHTLVAHFAKVGTNLVGWTGYRGIMGISGGLLIYFGARFLGESLG